MVSKTGGRKVSAEVRFVCFPKCCRLNVTAPVWNDVEWKYIWNTLQISQIMSVEYLHTYIITFKASCVRPYVSRTYRFPIAKEAEAKTPSRSSCRTLCYECHWHEHSVILVFWSNAQSEAGRQKRSRYQCWLLNGPKIVLKCYMSAYDYSIHAAVFHGSYYLQTRCQMKICQAGYLWTIILGIG